jgi:hypothetical protein
MQVYNKTRNTALITQGRVADTFWLRLKGLLGASPLKQGEGLVLVGEKSIHTLFMGFAIDVVYVSKDYHFIRVQDNMIPYRLGPFVGQAGYVLELPTGTIAESKTQVGDQLNFER